MLTVKTAFYGSINGLQPASKSDFNRKFSKTFRIMCLCDETEKQYTWTKDKHHWSVDTFSA